MSLARRLSRHGHRAAHPPARVQILTPLGDQCGSSYTGSLVRAMKHAITKGPEWLEDVAYSSISSSVLPFSRTHLVEQALSDGATHLLFIDSDMEFPGDLILYWLQFSQPILAANCIIRRPPYRSTAMDFEGRHVDTTPSSTGLERVARVGTGILWVQASVFATLSRPWFDFQYLEFERKWLGEDYYFSEKAREAGFELFIDHDVSKLVKHVGQMAFDPMRQHAAALLASEQMAKAPAA